MAHEQVSGLALTVSPSKQVPEATKVPVLQAPPPYSRHRRLPPSYQTRQTPIPLQTLPLHRRHRLRGQASRVRSLCHPPGHGRLAGSFGRAL